MFCVCVGRAGLPSVMLVSSKRLLCLCTVGMRVRCSGSITRDTGVDCLSLYHFDWSTPLAACTVGDRADPLTRRRYKKRGIHTGLFDRLEGGASSVLRRP